MTTYEHGMLWTKLKATCLKCNCEFIYMPKDLKKHIDYDFISMEGRAYKYVTCPECGTRHVYTSPASGRYYNDFLNGTPEQPGEVDYYYDGGDEDNIISIDEETDII